MKLSEIGEMANNFCLEIPEYYAFIKLDVHAVMPNHLHGIVIIDKPNNDLNGIGDMNIQTPGTSLAEK